MYHTADVVVAVCHMLLLLCAVYIGEDTPEEPDFQYIPDTHHSTLPPGGDPLSGSMLLLQEGLESGTLLAQFEVGLVSLTQNALGAQTVMINNV